MDVLDAGSVSDSFVEGQLLVVGDGAKSLAASGMRVEVTMMVEKWKLEPEIERIGAHDVRSTVTVEVVATFAAVVEADSVVEIALVEHSTKLLPELVVAARVVNVLLAARACIAVGTWHNAVDGNGIPAEGSGADTRQGKKATTSFLPCLDSKSAVTKREIATKKLRSHVHTKH
jgi:hypothetical protein